MGRSKIIIHDFYCLNCGKPVTAVRKKGQEREKYHRKKLYCPYCKEIVNHMEVRNQAEKDYFMEGFAAGAWKSEAVESLEVCKNETRVECLYRRPKR